ncbi:MAG: hypothetical protein FWB71_06585, partial [Defluviitaleaceae bacterium]|nr:hypothetical protein [Defluviitaleaceae bacterium]
MEQLIAIRTHIIGFYKRYEFTINSICKFLVGMFIFSRVNTLALYREEFAQIFETGLELPILLLASALFTVLPPSLAMFLIAAAITIQLSAVLEVALLVFVLLSLIIVFYCRLAPRMSFLILAIILGFHFGMPYLVLIFAGMYIGPLAIIPIAIGVAIWYFLPFFTDLALVVPIPEEFDIFAVPISLVDVFSQVYQQLTYNFNWVLIGFVFAMVILATYAVSKVNLDYAKDIAIVAGGFVAILAMAMTVTALETDMTVGSVIGSVIISMLIMVIIKFFDCILDYKRVERVTFEDEENVYYVKIIPKVGVIKDPEPEPEPDPEPT